MYSNKQKIISISLYFLAGTFLLFVIKFQATQTVKEGGIEKKFFHPYMQSFTIFLGETLYILFYFAEKVKLRNSVQKDKKLYNSSIFIIPAIADTFTSVLQMLAINFLSGSTFLMLKGSAVVTTLLFSKLLLKKKLQIRHYVGCSITIIGIFIVGGSSFFDNETGSKSNEITGYIFMLVSIFFNGFFYAYEQYLLRKYKINIYQMVAYQGIYGGMIILALTIGLSYVPCSLGNKICVLDSTTQPFYQLPLVYFYQITTNFTLLVLTISTTMLIGIFILNGIKITNMFDALTKSIVNITKTTLVWIVGIIITVIGGADNPDFKFQSLGFVVNLIKMVGFVAIIFGNLIYNKLVMKGWFETKKIERREMVEEITTPNEKVNVDSDAVLEDILMVKEDEFQ